MGRRPHDLTKATDTMKDPVQNLQEAMRQGITNRPTAGGFPYLAETLRQAGVTNNRWSLPSCQSIYITLLGNVVLTGQPVVAGMEPVPAFDRDALVKAIRADQAGETTFQEFLASAWEAGCVSYDVDFEARTVAYYGVSGEVYLEDYPAITL